MSGAFWSVLRSLGSISAPASMLALAAWSSIRTAFIIYGVIVVVVIAYEVGRNSPAGAERPE